MNGKHDCFVLKYAFSFKLSTIEPSIQVARFKAYIWRALFLILSIELYSFILRDANSNL